MSHTWVSSMSNGSQCLTCGIETYPGETGDDDALTDAADCIECSETQHCHQIEAVTPEGEPWCVRCERVPFGGWCPGEGEISSCSVVGCPEHAPELLTVAAPAPSEHSADPFVDPLSYDRLSSGAVLALLSSPTYEAAEELAVRLGVNRDNGAVDELLTRIAWYATQRIVPWALDADVNIQALDYAIERYGGSYMLIDVRSDLTAIREAVANAANCDPSPDRVGSAGIADFVFAAIGTYFLECYYEHYMNVSCREARGEC